MQCALQTRFVAEAPEFHEALRALNQGLEHAQITQFPLRMPTRNRLLSLPALYRVNREVAGMAAQVTPMNPQAVPHIVLTNRLPRAVRSFQDAPFGYDAKKEVA